MINNVTLVDRITRDPELRRPGCYNIHMTLLNFFKDKEKL